MLLLACKRLLKKNKSIYIIKAYNSYMKAFVKKAGIFLIYAVIAGNIISFPAQASANQGYNPNTFELNIGQTEFYKPKQMSLEEITEQLSGWTYADRVLIAGMPYGVDYAREQTEKGMTDPFGNKFDYILAPNPTGNLILNFFGAILTNIRNSPMDIKDNYGNIDKLRVNELWCHSQGGDTFINWANTGEIKAKILYLTGAPMASGFGYIDKLRKAAAMAGVEKIFIYQNDGDHVTRIKFPSLQQVKDPKSFKVGMFWEIGNKNLENRVNIKIFELYTSPGKNKEYTKDNIQIFEVHNMPASGHWIGEYYENIKAIPG